MSLLFLEYSVYFGTVIILITVAILSYLFLKRKEKRGLIDHEIHVISTIEEWNVVENDFYTNVFKSKVIGLDCEWTSEGGSRHPVALLQMATGGICILFRLCTFNADLPPLLVELLADKKILKVGVDIWGDQTKLLHDHKITVKGCLDLRCLVERTPKAALIKKFGLSGMASSILEFELCKERNIRCSNWEQETLTKKQINYAAQDATVAFQIFKEVVRSTLSYFSSLSLIVYSELEILYRQALHICASVIDVPYKCRRGDRKVDFSKEKEPKGCLLSLPVRAKPLYGNCKLEAPDGELLCVCDMRKAQWYVDRNLGEIIETDPFTVRLNFEPSGRPELDDVYYIHQRKNCCVVCGKGDSYLKKKIVPHEYRRHFPDLMKNHLSHDVLLLCFDCHRESSAHDMVFREALAEECDAPLPSRKNSKVITDRIAAKVHSAARALTQYPNNIPKPRMEELEKYLKDYFEVEEVTPEILQEALNIEYRNSNENYASHGLKVVQYKSRTIGLPAFESQWRQHFLDTMQPQYLPKMWSVHHHHERLIHKIKRKGIDFDMSVLGEMDGIIYDAPS